TGELIGINSQILSTSGGNIGIGFAIPSNMARNVMDQLIKTGKVHRGQLGVGIQPMTPELANQFGLSETRGVLVNTVTDNGPAAQAGIRRGDVIIAFNGKPVSDGNALRNEIASTAPGTQVQITVVRDKREQQLQVTLGEYQPPRTAESRNTLR
ncbi:MAG TPA: PDZ domain-containing protein, partial [Bryobacteraceae bacterium]